MLAEWSYIEKNKTLLQLIKISKIFSKFEILIRWLKEITISYTIIKKMSVAEKQKQIVHERASLINLCQKYTEKINDLNQARLYVLKKLKTVQQRFTAHVLLADLDHKDFDFFSLDDWKLFFEYWHSDESLQPSNWGI